MAIEAADGEVKEVEKYEARMFLLAVMEFVDIVRSKAAFPACELCPLPVTFWGMAQ